MSAQGDKYKIFHGWRIRRRPGDTRVVMAGQVYYREKEHVPIVKLEKVQPVPLIKNKTMRKLLVEDAKKRKWVPV